MRLLAHWSMEERSQAAEARRVAMHFATRMNYTETVVGKVGVVVSEAASNLLKHAKQGEILLSAAGSSLELLAIDRGPGMDVAACLRDGYSTAGTQGSGLGAMSRMSDHFDAYSNHAGTVLWAAFGPHNGSYGAARAPKKGETLCGDSWSVIQNGSATWVLVVDGLGHGEFAALAAERAVQAFEDGRFDTVTGMMDNIHAALRPTRGAAVAVASIEGDTVNYCGLGNIAGVLYGGGSNIHMVSFNGTAGVEARKIAKFTYKWNPGAILIMHSDGLQTQWTLDKYPGIMRQSPAVIAGVLYRDFTRGRDDSTVLVVRQ